MTEDQITRHTKFDSIVLTFLLIASAFAVSMVAFLVGFFFGFGKTPPSDLAGFRMAFVALAGITLLSILALIGTYMIKDKSVDDD